jgi:hypothetical protein
LKDSADAKLFSEKVGKACHEHISLYKGVAKVDEANDMQAANRAIHENYTLHLIKNYMIAEKAVSMVVLQCMLWCYLTIVLAGPFTIKQPLGIWNIVMDQNTSSHHHIEFVTIAPEAAFFIFKYCQITKKLIWLYPCQAEGKRRY